MASSASSPNPPSASEENSGFGCFLQVATGLGGFFILVVLTVLIMREESWTFTLKDALFWAVVIGMIVAKQVEATRFGAASEDEPQSSSSALRYAVVLGGVAGCVWTIAQTLSD